MKQLHVVPLAALGAVSYLVGIVLIIAPFVLDLAPDSPATLASVLLGVALLVLTLVGDSPVGAARLVPARVLEATWYLLGLLLVLFPFVAALTGDRQAVLAYVVLGVALFALTLLADFPRKHAPRTGGEAAGAHGPGAEPDEDVAPKEASTGTPPAGGPPPG